MCEGAELRLHDGHPAVPGEQGGLHQEGVHRLQQEGKPWMVHREECVKDKVKNYGYMTVSLLSRENRVAYIKREYTVYNKKVPY